MFNNSVFTSDEQEALFHACVNLIGRSGAREAEFGYLNEDVPVANADWWAIAHYKGARLMVEHYRHPTDALMALAIKVVQGGKCINCGRVVTLTPGEYFVYIESTLLDGEKWDAEQTSQLGSCLWEFNGEIFVQECKKENEETNSDSTSAS